MRLSCCEEGRAELRVCPFVPAGGLGAREGARGRQRAQRACRWTNEVRPLNSCPPPPRVRCKSRASHGVVEQRNKSKHASLRCCIRRSNPDSRSTIAAGETRGELSVQSEEGPENKNEANSRAVRQRARRLVHQRP